MSKTKSAELKLGYLIVYVPDVAKAMAFYKKAFALTERFLHESGQYGELETGATALAFAAESIIPVSDVVQPNRPENKAAGAEVGLVTDDVRGAFDRAVSAGATAVLVPTVKPWGQTVSYVRDLNGFLVELCSPVRH